MTRRGVKIQIENIWFAKFHLCEYINDCLLLFLLSQISHVENKFSIFYEVLQSHTVHDTLEIMLSYAYFLSEESVVSLKFITS